MNLITEFLKQFAKSPAEEIQEETSYKVAMYPIKPPYNSGQSEAYLLNMLNNCGGGGDNGGIFPRKTVNLSKENHHTIELTKFMQYEEAERLDILYEFMLNNSEDNIYTLESDRKLTEAFENQTGLTADRGTIKKYVNKLIDKGWISELIEIHRKYKLIKPD